MSSVSGSTLDDLVNSYRASISKPVTTMQTQQQTLNYKLSNLSTLKAKLVTLSTTASSLGLAGTSSPFLTYGVESSNTTSVTATATSAALAGTHSLRVSQLATNDTLLSNALTAASDSGLTASTSYSFSVGLADGTSKTVSVGLGTATTNTDVLSAVASAINADSTLKAKMTASVVSIDGTNSRLVLTSKKSGASNAVTSFGGDFNSLLGYSGVDFTNRTASTSSSAGFMKSGTAKEALNAKFVLDGISMSRESNTISDALKGTTLTLKATQAATDSDVTLTTSVDATNVKTQVQTFITNYNDALSYLTSNMKTDAKAGTRGIFTSDSALVGLRSSLRALASGVVSGTSSGNPTNLSAIGITTAEDGTLSLSDETTFDNAISTDVHQVADLFMNGSGSGLATKIKSTLDGFTSAGGQIALSTNSINSQLTYISNRITTLNSHRYSSIYVFNIHNK